MICFLTLGGCYKQSKLEKWKNEIPCHFSTSTLRVTPNTESLMTLRTRLHQLMVFMMFTFSNGVTLWRCGVEVNGNKLVCSVHVSLQVCFMVLTTENMVESWITASRLVLAYKVLIVRLTVLDGIQCKVITAAQRTVCCTIHTDRHTDIQPWHISVFPETRKEFYSITHQYVSDYSQHTTHLLMLFTQLLLILHTEHYGFCAILTHIAENGCRFGRSFIF